MNLLNFLSETLLIDEEDILKFSVTAPYRYKLYSIDKRNGKGKRLIAHPSKELKFMQKIMTNKFTAILPIHDNSFAYKKEVSIKDNALMHVKSKYLLKMDFKDFFPSITPELLFKILDKFGYQIGDEDRKLLESLLFYRIEREGSLRLSIGAPSSPFISNFIMYHFDEAMKTSCDLKKIKYSRYADDITFSTNLKGELFAIPAIVESALNKYCYGKVSINTEKTIYSSKAHNRHVTGVTITNEDKLSLGRERKRLISSMTYRFKNQSLNEGAIGTLIGLISFALHIEPIFVKRLLKKYGNETLSKLVTAKVMERLTK
jgi:RNA-directed DNA polymerase